MKSRVDIYVTEDHYRRHAELVLREVCAELRGHTHTHQGVILERGAKPSDTLESLNSVSGPILVSSYYDMVKIRPHVRRPIVLMEHGAGQTYSGKGETYADSEDKRGCAHYFAPGPWAYERHTKHHPRIPATMIGSPAARYYEKWVRDHKLPNTRPVVGFGWHWDCKLVPETNATWQNWLDAIAPLTSLYTVLGHGHPREIDKLAAEYRARNIPLDRDLDRVLLHSDVYCVDNSSTAFEALAAGIPVLLLDAPGWEKSTHGLRFGAVGNLFPRCNRQCDLVPTISRILQNPVEALKNREEILASVYSGDVFDAVRVLEGMCA